MPLNKYQVEYETDCGKTVDIIIGYESENGRLAAGGMTAKSAPCGFTLNRRQLKPRYLVTADKGLIYFKTNSDMCDYINTNKDKIIRAVGEQLNCGAINFLY